MSKIIIVPSVFGVIEYALEVRNRIRSLLDKNFILAVEIPKNFTKQVISSIKDLPLPSIVVDEFNRALPVIPSDSMIEGIRFCLEKNIDIKFVDLNNFNYNLFPKYKNNVAYDDFVHLGKKIGFKEYAQNYNTSWQTDILYHSLRERKIVSDLIDLSKEYDIVLFICGLRHWKNINYYLKNCYDSVIDWDDEWEVKAYGLSNENLGEISVEIPYFMYLYEIFRDKVKEFDRGKSIFKIFKDSDKVDISQLIKIYKYARNLALTDFQIYPDIYNIWLSAKSCIDDEYASKVIEKACYYPYIDEIDNFKLSDIVNLDLIPFCNEGIFTSKLKTDRDPVKPKILIEKYYGSDIEFFFRTYNHQIIEREFIDFIYRKCVSHLGSDFYNSEKFVTGQKDGIDIRKTIRYSFFKQIYVKKNTIQNLDVDYAVIDLGNFKKQIYVNKVFLDEQYFTTGSVHVEKIDSNTSKYNFLRFIVFFNYTPGSYDEIRSMFGAINPQEKIRSCIRLGIKYSNSRYIFIFTDSKISQKIKKLAFENDKILVVIPLNSVPTKLIEKYSEFYGFKS